MGDKNMNSGGKKGKDPKKLPAKDFKTGGKTLPTATEGDKKARGKKTEPIAGAKNNFKGF